jgi:hypothetical protein
MKSKTLYQFCIISLRYSQHRDNHLAPWQAIQNINEALKEMEIDFKDLTIKQIISEIESDLKVNDREQKGLWLEFRDELKRHLT